MRCLGEIENRKSAEQFVAFLLTQGISTHVDEASAGEDRWELWVKEEDRLEEAGHLLRQFEADPDNAKYQTAMREAGKILADKARQREAVVRNARKATYSVNPLADRRIPPLTLSLVILSCAVSLLSNFGNPGMSNELGRSIKMQLGFISPIDYQLSNGDPAASLKKGEIWRAITPIFIHLNMWHLAFNVMGLVVFGRLTERWMGTTKYALLILATALASNLLQGLAPEWLRGSPNFGGISGVVYGLFGYVWVRTSLNPNLGVVIPFSVVILLLLPLIIGMSGVIPNEYWRYADLAHLGGLIVGSLVGYLQER